MPHRSEPCASRSGTSSRSAITPDHTARTVRRQIPR
jgi:hypothetical protein